MNTEKNFTDLFFTVPFYQKIMTRDGNGKKVDENNKPIIPPKWEQYQVNRNTKNTPILGAIALDDFIGIDIDDPILWDKAKELLTLVPCDTYVSESLPLNTKGGHILIPCTKDNKSLLSPMVNILKKECKVDVQIGKKLIYLATKANKTKQLLNKDLEVIHEDEYLNNFKGLKTPMNVLLWLSTLYMENRTKDTNTTFTRTQPKAPTKSEEYFDHIEFLGVYLDSINLEKILTNRDKKDIKKLLNKLSPTEYKGITSIEDLDGIFTDWGTKLRYKLAIDSSVSEEMFTAVFKTIVALRNNDNYTMTRADEDLARDMNSSFWSYDPRWKSKGLLIEDVNNNVYEVLVNIPTSTYLLVNRSTGAIYKYASISNLIDMVYSVASKSITKKTILAKARSIVDTYDPTKPSYFSTQEVGNGYETIFNRFIPSEGMSLIRGTSKLVNYKEPKTILWFLEHLIPDNKIRGLLMQYIRRKAITLDHSPLYFAFYGVGGAGKGVLINDILEYMFGEGTVLKQDLNTMLNNFKGDWIGKFVLEFDEPDGLSYKQLEKLTGELKKLTGSETIRIEKKGQEGELQRHFLTPIITTNNVVKLINGDISDDRRLVVVNTPTKLLHALPVVIDGIEFTTTTQIVESIREELPYFAVYLKENVADFTKGEYEDNTLWKTELYETFVDSTLSVRDRLKDTINRGATDELVLRLLDLGVDTDEIEDMFSTFKDGKSFILNTGSTHIKSLGQILRGVNINFDVDSLHPAIKKAIKVRGKAVHGVKITMNTPYIFTKNEEDNEIKGF